MASPTRRPEDLTPNASLDLNLRKILGSLQTAPNPVTIVINGGRPSPREALAFRGARVQFQNNDNQAYRIQVTNIVTLDYYLPPFATLTVFVNNGATVPSEIDYDLSIADTPPDYPLHLLNALNAQNAVSAFAGSDALHTVSAFAKSAFPVSDELSVASNVADTKAEADMARSTYAASLSGPGGKIIVKG
jgi:hypothetical protein